MYHAHFRGTHYEAGFRWGSLLLKHKNIILEHVPFEITDERLEFAMSCVPIYQRYYPEILDEIQGLADGQCCDVRLFQAVLFSMYALPPVCCCSCFAEAADGNILFGRNSDFLTDLEKMNLNVIYDLADNAYSFTGNTTAFIEMEDGVNEYGFAIGLTSVYPLSVKPGFNAGLLLRYLLEKCRKVSEALQFIKNLPIASAQTLTMADAGGNIAVVECNAQRTEAAFCILDKCVCATNIFHLPGMEIFNHPGIDDWFAGERYQTLITALSQKDVNHDLDFAQNLLSGKYGFMCQYDRSTGKDTVWSVVYDLKHRKIYRAEGNPRRHHYKEDMRFQ